MITGVHALFYTTDAEAARAFLRDVLRLPHYDAGNGWLLFDAPSGIIGCHPADRPMHGVSFSCDNLAATMRELKERGVAFTTVEDQGWGLVTTFEIPGGGPVQLYQPKYERA